MVIKMESNNLEEAALRRKEKLNALKRKKEGTTDIESDDNNDQQSLPKPIFRSYKPSHDKLKENAVPDAQPVEVEEFVKDQLRESTMKEVIDELDITTLAPRKPDWDLKRDVAKKLEKLERRTQKAIAELIRDRLKQRQDDSAAIVSVGVMNENDNSDSKIVK